MEPIERYEDLSALASRHMTRGVRANTMVSPAEYGRAIETGALQAASTPAGLLLVRDRGDHRRLTFFLNDLTVPPDTALPAPLVTEVAYRPRDVGLQETVPYLQKQGFFLLFERIRMSRPAGLPETDESYPVSPAKPEDHKIVMALLRETFSPLTGCLPNDEELADDLAAGRVLLLREGERPLGLLHFSFDGKSGEIRHLAVAEDCRGKGLTRPLLSAYLNAVGGAKSTVWLRDGYAAAQNAYSRFGFAPDGRRSAVLCYDR